MQNSGRPTTDTRPYRQAVARFVGAVAFVCAFQGAAFAAEKELRVLGWNGNQPQQQLLEKPFWAALDKSTDGKLSAQFRTIDELGLKGFEAMRTLQSGAFDIVSIQTAFVSGDDPFMVGTDLPGLAATQSDVDKINDAYRATLDKHLNDAYDAKLLAIWSYPPQILYCRDAITNLSALKGKKVRTQSAFASSAMQHLGASVVSLAGPEVYQAMLQGVVDCAITGSAYAAANDWHEVAKTVYPLPFGGNGIAVHTIRNATWKGLTPDQQKALLTQMAVLEQGFRKMAVETHVDGLNCNTGKEPCSTKRLGSMTIATVSDADKKSMQEIVTQVVLPAWLKDCAAKAPTCKADWNSSVGKAIDIQM